VEEPDTVSDGESGMDDDAGYISADALDTTADGEADMDGGTE
jgi:hypothetical protein